MKARLKSIILPALGVLGLFSAVTVSSCNNDPCQAIVCSYGGTCTEGDCICPSGYEGTHCEIVTREKYEGIWTVFENGTVNDPAIYQITFINREGATEMTINNFYNRFAKNQVNVRVKGDTLTIPQQVVDNYTIEGYGYLQWTGFYPENGEMTVYYKVTDPTGKTDDYGFNVGEPSKWHTTYEDK